MRARRVAFLIVGSLALRCGGGGTTGRSHPQLDKDYADSFAGTWVGSATLSVTGQPPQTQTGNQSIGRTGFNRLSITQLCSGVDGAAGLDSATTFSIDPLTCAPANQSCGPVTIHYDGGTGALSQETLTVTLTGNASGCGQTLPFTLTFSGTKSASGPVPPPPGLWQAPAGSTPASGNYVYLQSEAGDYIGGGNTFTYTPPSSPISLSGSGSHVAVSVVDWFGDFQGMAAIAQLQPGYYGNLTRFPFHNPAHGGLNWSGQGRGCNTLTGWFVVDLVTYAGAAPSAIDLRFEQHCEGASPALHGQMHWTASGT